MNNASDVSANGTQVSLHRVDSDEEKKHGSQPDITVRDAAPAEKTMTAMTDDMIESGPEEAKELKRIMRKLDKRLIPICSLLYLISFLDRSAIGNARVLGLTGPRSAGGLQMSDTIYSLALALFFPFYGTFLVISIPAT